MRVIVSRQYVSAGVFACTVLPEIYNYPYSDIEKSAPIMFGRFLKTENNVQQILGQRSSFIFRKVFGQILLFEHHSFN